MSKAEASSDEEDAPAAAGESAAGSFFSSALETSTQLQFTEVVRSDLDEERLPGEGDSDDESRARYLQRKLKKVRQRKNHRRIVIQMAASKYDVIADAARDLGYRVAPEDSTEEYNLLWADSYIPYDTIASLNKYQKCNHFPGMSELAKKNLLAKNLNRMLKALPGEFGFVPPTFSLPGDAEPMKAWFQSTVG